jgi:hypothetical protein
MSHSYGMVKFSDGEILHIEFNGTVDVCLPNLYKTDDEVEKNWRKQEWKYCSCKPITQEPCEIAVTYGRGWYWNGFACRKCMVITNNFEPFGYEPDYQAEDGLPEWYPNREAYLL